MFKQCIFFFERSFFYVLWGWCIFLEQFLGQISQLEVFYHYLGLSFL